MCEMKWSERRKNFSSTRIFTVNVCDIQIERRAKHNCHVYNLQLEQPVLFSIWIRRRTNILWILSELIFYSAFYLFFLFFRLFVCILCGRKKIVVVFNRNDKLFVNFRKRNAFHSHAHTASRHKRTEKALATQFYFHPYSLTFSSSSALSTILN